MYLKDLAASGFRNLSPFRLTPSERFTIFEGPNGQGKTNILEAIYLLSAFKSHRDARSAEIIAFGESSASVRGVIVRQTIERTVEVQLSSKGKKVLLDDKAITALPTSFSHLNAVSFGPDDLGLTKGGPGPRRSFVDRAIFGSSPDYLIDLKGYRQALDSRNRLIRDSRDRQRGWRGGGALDETVLEAFEEALVVMGLRVLSARLRFLEGFRPCFQSIFDAITDGELKADIAPVLSVELDREALLHAPESQSGPWREHLRRARGTDTRLGYTRTGPHADEFLCSIEGHPVRTYASQGQHRAFILALKLAELERTRQAIGIYPIFLLDDVSSELDERRNHHLMKALETSGGQVFITTTDRRWIRVDSNAARIFKVKSGMIEGACDLVTPERGQESLDATASDV